MLKAAQRKEASRGLLDLQTTLAATAACWSKDGQRMVDKVRAELLKQLE